MPRLLLVLLSIVAILPAAAQNVRPFSIGETLRVHSDSLREARSVNIYLPADYREADTSRYHVIYLLDGSADEDFIHVAGLVQFYTFPWIQLLPPTIVVGIANVDRRRDFSFPTRNKSQQAAQPTAGHSAPFIAFIESELIPLIRNRYRCTGERTLIGQSLGGLLAAEILQRKPQLFNRYLIISPSLWWDDGSMLAARFGPFNQRTDVYIAVGKEGLTPGSRTQTMEEDAKAFATKLQAQKDPMLKVSFDYLPDEEHAGIGHQAVMNGFRRLFSKPQQE